MKLYGPTSTDLSAVVPIAIEGTIYQKYTLSYFSRHFDLYFLSLNFVFWKKFPFQKLSEMWSSLLSIKHLN